MMPADDFSEPAQTLGRLAVRHFRCFEKFEAEFAPGTNFIIGPNARGKTSLLEAACILLRLQSPRVTRLAAAIQHERAGFVLDGYFGRRHLQFYFGRVKKKLALDSVPQTEAREYLQCGRVAWFASRDLELVRGSGEVRRRWLDFTGAQLDAAYRQVLRAYERALRSRNLLLKQPAPRWREIAAFDGPLIEHGEWLLAARRRLLTALAPHLTSAHAAISQSRETPSATYAETAEAGLAAALEKSKPQDARLRQTTVGPHRDDLLLELDGHGADLGSEGQQRTLVLSLKLAAARLLEEKLGVPPVLLIDDVFGELDPSRRNALLAALPASSQRIVTTTFLDWMDEAKRGAVIELGER